MIIELLNYVIKLMVLVRKFNYDNFNITCKDQLTANSINTLLNCSNSSVDDIVETFKNEIAYSNIH